MGSYRNKIYLKKVVLFLMGTGFLKLILLQDEIFRQTLVLKEVKNCVGTKTNILNIVDISQFRF